jgi:hypothetical protein
VTWVIRNLVSVQLEIVLVLVQDRCPIYAKCTIGSEIVLDAPKVLLGDEAQLEARFGLFGDSANLDERMLPVSTERGSCGISFRSVWRRCLCQSRIGEQTYQRIRNRFGHTRWYS